MNKTNRLLSTRTNELKKNDQQRDQNPTLMAAAFQDHLIRSMSLTNSIGPRKVRPGRATQMKMKKDIKPLVDTGRNTNLPVKKKTEVEQEFVLDRMPPPMTLAQKFGLVEAPTQLLSETDWQVAKASSNKRDDSQLPCVICKEDFGLQQQVLLSCTHVFHRACLEAFERFTGKKTCPMCRKEQYQTRVIHEGAKQHRVKCATMFQALWRGYVVRCWYRRVREMIPPKDSLLRKRFYEDKLESITDRIVRSCDFNVNSFLSEIDRSLEASREVFRNFDAMFQQLSEEEWECIQLKAVERGETDCPICLTSLQGQESEPICETENRLQDVDINLGTQKQKSGHASHNHVTKSNRSKPRTGIPTGTVPNAPGKTNNSNSTGRYKQGTQCQKVNQLSSASEKSLDCKAKSPQQAGHMASSVPKKRHTVLLSCSHVFHKTCLETFEELAVGQVRSVCPVCRTAYQKRVLEL